MRRGQLRIERRGRFELPHRIRIAASRPIHRAQLIMRNRLARRKLHQRLELRQRLFRSIGLFILDAEVEPGVRKRGVQSLYPFQQRHALRHPIPLQQRERVVQFFTNGVGREVQRLLEFGDRLRVRGWIFEERFSKTAMPFKRGVGRCGTHRRRKADKGTDTHHPYASRCDHRAIIACAGFRGNSVFLLAGKRLPALYPDRVAARPSPTFGLLAGLVVTLSAASVYAAYTVTQLRSLRRIQVETIDRNRADSLLLLRIQNNLNAVALTMRDMLDPGESYPLIAWKGQLRRIEVDLGDAMAREEKVSRATPDQRAYLSGSVAAVLGRGSTHFRAGRSGQGQEEEARARIRLSLQARQEALSNAVARLLVQNNESEQLAAVQTPGHLRPPGEQRLHVPRRHADSDRGHQPLPGPMEPRHVRPRCRRIRAAQRTGAAADLHSGKHLSLHFARITRRLRADSHRHRRDAAPRRENNSRRRSSARRPPGRLG